MGKITVGQLAWHLFQINENDGQGLNVDAYLAIGARSAALIDTLQDTEELYNTVSRLTDLPLSVFLTHGHPDHAGRGIRQFHEAGVPVYMTKEDIHLYTDDFHGEYPAEWFSVLSEGDTFDLGGVTLETILCKGHTPGSAVFFDEENRRLFSGDAVGSGMFWMQIPGCLPLHKFRHELKRLMARMDPYEDLKIYPGHRWQSDTQLNLQYLHDTLDLTDQILAGTDNGKDMDMVLGSLNIHYRECSYGMMNAYSYNPENL